MLSTGAGNVVPGRYRGVSVAVPDCDLQADELRAHFLGREAYRRTRFLVLRRGGATALLRIHRASEVELFSPITDVQLLAGPEDCAFLALPDVDTGIPSMLAAAAAEHAPGARAVVVQGRYQHVNFILEPRPLPVMVAEVVPPEPAKLVDQARRVLAVAEDLPPIQLEPRLTDLVALARQHPAEHYLLPCRGSGSGIPGSRVSYLDERPPRAAWTLLGCDRSREIHRWFYGDDAPGADLCPRRAAAADAGSGAQLTKCCQQEEHLEAGAGWVSVPWGSSLEQVRQALTRLAHDLEPEWAPA